MKALLGCAAVVLLLAGPAEAAARADDPLQRPLLRLTDVGPGMAVSDDGSCGLGPSSEGASRRLRAFVRARRSFRGCSIALEELWRAPGTGPRPQLIESLLLRFHRRGDARAAMRIGRDFAGYSLGLPVRSLKSIPTDQRVGDDSRVYRTKGAVVGDQPYGPAAVVVWRTGRLLSAVLVGGDGANPGIALGFAALQQARIKRPGPIPRGANDDLLVPLDDPFLGVTVNWLGRVFRPPGLPRTALDDALASGRERIGPGATARLGYGGDVALDVWRPGDWARFVRSRSGRLLWTRRCTTATRVALERGYAILFAGHEKRQKRCGRRPDRYMAHVYLPGSVVSVNAPTCARCIDRGRGRDPYDSERGMRSVVAALRERQAPVLR